MGFALKIAGVGRPRAAARRARGGEDPGPDDIPRSQAQGALRWPASARRDGPGHRPPPAGVPDGRAAVEPRRQAARADAYADRVAAAPARRHDGHVTHDQTEALTMGDRIAVLDRGLLQQVGTPAADLYDHPNNVFVAGFIGSPAMNLLPVRPAEGGVKFGSDAVPLDRDDGPGSRQRQPGHDRRAPRGHRGRTGRRQGPDGRRRPGRRARRRRRPPRPHRHPARPPRIVARVDGRSPRNAGETVTLARRSRATCTASTSSRASASTTSRSSRPDDRTSAKARPGPPGPRLRAFLALGPVPDASRASPRARPDPALLDAAVVHPARASGRRALVALTPKGSRATSCGSRPDPGASSRSRRPTESWRDVSTTSLRQPLARLDRPCVERWR